MNTEGLVEIGAKLNNRTSFATGLLQPSESRRPLAPATEPSVFIPL